MVQPVVLCILGGWGYREEVSDNAIALAKTPVWDRFIKDYPNGYVGTDGPFVGLPQGQMGNSEVGHMNIGAGRVALPEFGRIDAMLGDGSMAENGVLQDFIESLKRSGGRCHLLGLLSEGGVHSHQDQMLGFAKLIAHAGVEVIIHAFSDGRDTPPRSANEFFSKFSDVIQGESNISFGTISGRFWAMDRDLRWDRVEKTYLALTEGQGRKATLWQDAIEIAYREGENDEFITPTVLDGYCPMQDGDGVLMVNFRADRAREILMALLYKDFDGFNRSKRVNFASAVGAVRYSSDLDSVCKPMVLPLHYPNTLGEYVSKQGLKQLRIAETEKYAHVTFFLNGGAEQPFEGEDRILIPSPKVKTYDLKPEMSAQELTDKLVDALDSKKYSLIVVNYANADMVGHTGDLNAAIQAIQTLDTCLGRLAAATQKNDAYLLITADHGNSEMMRDPVTNQPHTQHTTFLVPLVMIPFDLSEKESYKVVNGKLADLAPTVLSLMGVTIPFEMTGDVLVQKI